MDIKHKLKKYNYKYNNTTNQSKKKNYLNKIKYYTYQLGGGYTMSSFVYEGNKFSYPVSFYQIKVPSKKFSLLLFGDYHWSLENSCDACDTHNCTNFTEFISKLTEYSKNKRNFDFFVEEPYRKRELLKKIPPTSKGDGVLDILHSIFNDCIVDAEISKVKCKNKFGENFRYHYIDYRFGNEVLLDLWYNILGGLHNAKNSIVDNFNDFGNICNDQFEMGESCENLRESYSDHFSKILDKMIFILDIDFKILAKDVYIGDNSKIKKQIDNITDPNIRDRLTKYITVHLSNIDIDPKINDIRSLLINIIKENTDNNILNEINLKIVGSKMTPWDGAEYFSKIYDYIDELYNSIFEHIFSPALDFYSVARLFKLDSQYNDLDIVVFYCGDAHIRNILDILNAIFDNNLIFHNKIPSRMNERDEPIRCLEDNMRIII